MAARSRSGEREHLVAVNCFENKKGGSQLDKTVTLFLKVSTGSPFLTLILNPINFNINLWQKQQNESVPKELKNFLMSIKLQ